MQLMFFLFNLQNLPSFILKESQLDPIGNPPNSLKKIIPSVFQPHSKDEKNPERRNQVSLWGVVGFILPLTLIMVQRLPSYTLRAGPVHVCQESYECLVTKTQSLDKTAFTKLYKSFHFKRNDSWGTLITRVRYIDQHQSHVNALLTERQSLVQHIDQHGYF